MAHLLSLKSTERPPLRFGTQARTELLLPLVRPDRRAMASTTGNRHRHHGWRRGEVTRDEAVLLRGVWAFSTETWVGAFLAGMHPRAHYFSALNISNSERQAADRITTCASDACQVLEGQYSRLIV